MIQKPINATLPASTGTAALISLPDGQNCTDFAVQARGSVAMLISDVQAMTTYWTVKADTAQSLALILGKGATMFYAISDGDASTVEILPLRM